MLKIGKSIALSILSGIGILSVFVYPPCFHKWFKMAIAKIRTYRIAYGFKSAGRKLFIGESVRIIGGDKISIGDEVVIGDRAILSVTGECGVTAWPKLEIGSRTSFGEDCRLSAVRAITIGCDVLMGKGVTITDNSHGNNSIDVMQIPPINRLLVSKGGVFIGDRVWIGDKVTILPGVTLGEGTIVGSNSVVTKSFPANSVVGGVPASIIGGKK